MKLLASQVLLGLAFIFFEVGASQAHSSSLPYYCPHKPGVHYYADVVTGCRVFHLCSGSEPLHFLCPTGLIFNEKARVCDFPSNVECNTTSAVLRLLGLRGERIPLSDAALQKIYAVAGNPPKVKLSSDYLKELLSTFNVDLRDSKTVSSSSQTVSSTSLSKYEPPEPSYVDEDLVELLIRRTEELKNSGQLVASDVDNYVLPPASPSEFGSDSAQEMVPSGGILQHIISHQASESEKVKPIRFPENAGLFKDIVKPVLTAVISDKATLINIKRALISGLVEVKPIVVELLRTRASRTKRSVEEMSTSTTPKSSLQDQVPPKLEGRQNEMSAIEKKAIQKFEEISDYFQQFLEAMSSDKAFRSAVIQELARVIEKEGLFDDFEDLLQFPTHRLRRKRFVDLNSPIVLPREIVETVRAGLGSHTKPIVKDVLAATLPAILRTASENVPLILNIVESLKPLMKDRFPTLVQHTATVMTKYERYKHSSPVHITLPPPAEIFSDFLPYALAGFEIGGEYMRKNPQATSALLFGKDGILSTPFSTSYRPSLRAV